MIFVYTLFGELTVLNCIVSVVGWWSTTKKLREYISYVFMGPKFQMPVTKMLFAFWPLMLQCNQSNFGLFQSQMFVYPVSFFLSFIILSLQSVLNKKRKWSVSVVNTFLVVCSRYLFIFTTTKSSLFCFPSFSQWVALFSRSEKF